MGADYDALVVSFNTFREAVPCQLTCCINLSQQICCSGAFNQRRIEEISVMKVCSGRYAGTTLGGLFTCNVSYAVTLLDPCNSCPDLNYPEVLLFRELCLLLWRQVAPELFQEADLESQSYCADPMANGSKSKDASSSDGEQLPHSDDCVTIVMIRNMLITLQQELRDVSDETRNLVNASLSQLEEQIRELSISVETTTQHGLMLECYGGALIFCLNKSDIIREQLIYERVRGQYLELLLSEEQGHFNTSRPFGSSDLGTPFEDTGNVL